VYPRVVQPEMPFPNLFQCNKVLVNQQTINRIAVQCTFKEVKIMLTIQNFNFKFCVAELTRSFLATHTELTAD
jgi:hypothetical protein